MRESFFIIPFFFAALAASNPDGTDVQKKPITEPPGNFATLAKQFDYDGTTPLDIEDKVIARHPGYTIHEITYASPISGRVPAFLLVPEVSGPHPALLFGHWGEGDNTEFLEEARVYARGGTVCLLPAYPWVRPPVWKKTVLNFDKPESDRDTYVQAVIDMRRGIDLLLARSDVDRKRLGYIGHSYGAQWGAILTAVDRRIRAAALMTGIPNLDCIFMRENNPGIKEFLKGLPPGQIEKYLALQSTLSAEKYIGHSAPCSLLFQFGELDRNFGQDAMKSYFAAASEPKKILWYEAGHDLADPQALLDRYKFLARPLDLPAKPKLKDG